MPSDRRAENDQDRLDRDLDRSEEAHWRVAEAGAEDEERRSDVTDEEDPDREEQRVADAARRSDKEQTDWEDEGGALRGNTP